MEPLKQTGFVNYFGPQRFGWSLHTAKVGLAMIQENYVSYIQPETVDTVYTLIIILCL